jgi:putative aldouronate transport system substrate-binding protein
MAKRLLMVTLALCVVAGLGYSEGGREKAGAPEASAKAAVKDYSKKVTIRYANITDKTDVNSDEFSKTWNKKFNVEWEMIPMTNDNAPQKLRIWINSGDMPDMVHWNYIHAEAQSYVEQKLIRKLPSDWKTRWPGAAFSYKVSGVGDQLDKAFGGAYALPKPIFSAHKPLDVLLPHYGLYMRKDWLQAVGANIKDYYSVQELMQIARLLKEKDPGKVGKKFVPIEVPTSLLPWIFVYPNSTYSQSSAPFYKDAKGKYQWGPASPETLAGLKLYKQAYDEGLLHPEFYTLQVGRPGEQTFYVAGAVGMNVAAGMASVANRYVTFMKANLSLSPDNLHFAFTVGQDGKYHAPEVINFLSALIFSPSMENAKFDRIMDLLDYSCTDEGQLQIRMGIEGTDWKKEANGELTSLLKDGLQSSDKYACMAPIYISLLLRSDDFALISPAIPKRWRDMAYNQYQTKKSLSDSSTVGLIDWNVFFYDSPAMRKATMDLAEEYAQIVLQKGDVETNFNNWVTAKMKLIQPVLDELNAKK